MKTTRYLLVLLCSAAVIAISTGRLAAQDNNPGRHMPRGNWMAGPGMQFDGLVDDPRRLFRLAEELELTTDQRDRIFSLVDAARPKVRDNMFRMMDTRRELQELVSSGESISDRKLKELTGVEGDAMAEMRYLSLKLQSDIRAVLTQEQLARMAESRERPGREFRRRGGERREMMRERMRELRQPGEG